MRKKYNEFLYIPQKQERIREKTMLARLAITVTIMVICLAAMSISAYAYFSCDIASGSNIIKAANFEASVTIAITDSKSNPVAVTKDGKVQTANLEAGKYTIKLTKGNSTAHTGFCVITIGDKTYYTDQIGVDVKKNLTDATVEFYLWLSAPTKIEVLSHWGTSVYYGYGDANRTEIFIESDDTLDLTTKTTSGDVGKSEDTADRSGHTTPTTDTETSSTQTSENATTSSAKTTTSAETTSPETSGSSEPTSTTEPGTSTTESTTTQPAETTEQPRPVTENTESTGAPTTEVNE